MTTDAEARRERVLAALVRAGEDGVSGQRLAAELGCSRAAVHRHVEALRRAGVPVDGVHDGYRLAADADPVCASVVQQALTPPLAGPVRWSASTGSTNDDLAAAAREGAPEGLVLGTDLQTRGRGRRGRDWVTAPGEALLCSVLLRPGGSAQRAGILPVVVAVAVAEALGEGVGIVWPNDLVVEGRKVCGILCELAADEAGVAWVVAGMGVNVRGAPELTDTRWTPGALGGRRRHHLLADLLASLNAHYVRWRDEGPGEALRAFRARDRLLGTTVTLAVGTDTVTGTAAGVDDEGRLVLHTGSGPRALSSGEVTAVAR